MDIGAYPGGWSQVSSKIVTLAKYFHLDIKKMDKIKNVTFLKCDFLEEKNKKKILNFLKNKIDVIISDMAANTTGNKVFRLYPN